MSVQLLHVSESVYKVLTDCVDAKVGQFSFYTFQRVSIKVLTDCADAKAGQVSFYTFQRVSIKC